MGRAVAWEVICFHSRLKKEIVVIEVADMCIRHCRLAASHKRQWCADGDPQQLGWLPA